MPRAAILVVDDDPPIRRMLDRTLTAEGYAVASAADGGAALAEVERSAPDLIVLDVAMPGVDGLAVCRRLRAKGLATPVLLLTARDDLRDRVGGLDAGADDYLVKPFQTEELLARVRALLRRGHTPEELLALGDLTFDVSTRTAQRGYIQSDDGKYRLLSGSVPYPLTPPHESVRQIFEAVDETRPLRCTFQKLGIQPAFSTVNNARMLLSTSVFPYLSAIANPGH